jgi:hypothetical protein
MMNLRLALFGGSALLLAMSGMSIVACSDNTNDGLPSATTKHDAGGDDGDDDDDDDASTTTGDASTGSKDAGTTDSSTNKDGSSGSCTGSAPFIPSATSANYCFSANTTGGCTSATGIVCCDLGVKTNGTTKYTASCVQSASDCVAPSGGYADIYACGSPHDCPSGQDCYITAYSGWDGGDFTDSCGKIVGGGASECKPTESDSELGSGSDLLVCTLSDAGVTNCPSGYTCTASSLYSKNFGVCIGPNN